MDIAVLGLGEAGARYAADLIEVGQTVRGFDPAETPTPTGVDRRSSIAEAVADVDLVIGFTGARVSVKVAAEAAPHVREGAVYADFNTGSPEAKRAVEALFEGVPGRAADVAVLAPVPREGARTPLLISGEGAEFAARFFHDVVGTDTESIDAPMGVAAGRKLLRSVFMKGLAAVVIEADEAASQAGSRDWIRAQMSAELGPDGAALVDRLIEGTHTHAERRLHEMEDTTAYLDTLQTPSDMSAAAVRWLARLARIGTEVSA